jgi:FtsZ-interacting cell division protein ZipA
MSTTGWVILLVIVVIVLAIVGFAVSRGRQHQARAKAEEMRADAERRDEAVQHTESQANQAEIQAERARVEAEQAQARAEEAKQAHLQEAAQREDQIRQADAIDPDVDHTSETYEPGTTRPEGEHRA